MKWLILKKIRPGFDHKIIFLQIKQARWFGLGLIWVWFGLNKLGSWYRFVLFHENLLFDFLVFKSIGDISKNKDIRTNKYVLDVMYGSFTIIKLSQ